MGGWQPCAALCKAAVLFKLLAPPSLFRPIPLLASANSGVLCLPTCAVTHGHPVGALHRLLQVHPNAKVAAHADELPFLVGDPPQPHSNATKQSLSTRAADALGWVGGWVGGWSGARGGHCGLQCAPAHALLHPARVTVQALLRR